MESGYIKSEITNQIGKITFYHPSHNSLPGNLLKELTIQIHKLGGHQDCSVILLQSEGDRTFCAGASFEELSAIENTQQGHAYFSGFAHVINAMRKCPRLIVGRVQGKAVGGGVGLIAAADYCFGLSKASIRLSELSLGIGPFVIGPAVLRKIGVSAYTQLSIKASEWHTASWAHQKGLYNEIFETISDLDRHLEELMSTLKNYDRRGMESFKKTLWRGTEDWDDLLESRAALSGSLILQETARKAIAAIKGQK